VWLALSVLSVAHRRQEFVSTIVGGAGSVSAVNAGDRLQELADQIVALRDAYYRGAPLVADAEYDAIEDELRT